MSPTILKRSGLRVSQIKYIFFPGARARERMGNQKQTADKSNAQGSQQAIEEMVGFKSILYIIYYMYIIYRRNGRFEIKKKV